MKLSLLTAAIGIICAGNATHAMLNFCSVPAGVRQDYACILKTMQYHMKLGRPIPLEIVQSLNAADTTKAREWNKKFIL